MFLCINYSKANSKINSLFINHYKFPHSIKNKKCQKKINYWKFLFRDQEKTKQKRAEKTVDVQQARLRVYRKRIAVARQLETADIQQPLLLANSNRNATARQLESADIRQARLLANSHRNAAARQHETADIVRPACLLIGFKLLLQENKMHKKDSILREMLIKHSIALTNLMQESHKIFIG